MIEIKKSNDPKTFLTNVEEVIDTLRYSADPKSIKHLINTEEYINRYINIKPSAVYRPNTASDRVLAVSIMHTVKALLGFEDKKEFEQYAPGFKKTFYALMECYNLQSDWLIEGSYFLKKNVDIYVNRAGSYLKVNKIHEPTQYFIPTNLKYNAYPFQIEKEWTEGKWFPTLRNFKRL